MKQPVVCVEKRDYPRRNAALAAMRDVWKDRHVAIEGESAQEWRLGVQAGWPMWPFPDANAEAILRSTFHVEPSDVHAFRRLVRWVDGPPYLFCLSHCWALWGWAQAVPGLPDEALTIVHVDAHADLEVPPLSCTPERGRYAAPVGGSTMDLRDADSVASLIEEGFVGVGGFITPLMHANRDCDLVHLAPAASEPKGARVTYLSPRNTPHRTFAGTHDRPQMMAEGRAQQVCLWTDQAEDLARMELRGAVLLDVDMDYFCNRFEQRSRPAAWGDSWEGVASEIDRVAAALRDAPWRDSVIAITVALSPGFFPSEYWIPSLARLEAALRSMYSGMPDPAS